MTGPDPLATCRSIPLDRVAAALGYRRDPADRARSRRDGSVISINGESFFDHLSGTKGGWLSSTSSSTRPDADSRTSALPRR